MERTDLPVQILREIRDAVRETNARVEQTNARVEQTNTRLDRLTTDLGGRIDQTNASLVEVRDELGRRITESELRTATAIVELAGAVQGVRDLLKDRLDLRDRVDRCEHEIELLKQRLET